MSLAEAQGIVLDVCGIVLIAWAAVQLVAGLFFILGAGRRGCRAEIVYFVQGKHHIEYPVVRLEPDENAVLYPIREGRGEWRQREGQKLAVTVPKKGKGTVRLADRKSQAIQAVLLAFGSAAIACCGFFLF